uniref:RING-type domain-containing protein n=1 Tax=Anopheles farauti TaxID=69004 RepID=A0A182QB10_9DIPT
MDVICTICLESLETGSIIATSCGHIFHTKCIVNWTNRSYCCPDCRQEPTIPLRVIHFTLQDAKSAIQQEEEENSPDDDDVEPSSPKTQRTVSLADGREWMVAYTDLHADSDSEDDTPVSKKRKREPEDQSHSHAAGGDGCRVCSRYRYLQDKAIALKSMLVDLETPPEPNQDSKSVKSESDTTISGPEKKRRRTQ